MCTYHFYSQGEDRHIKIWDLSSGAVLRDLKGHADTVFSLSFNMDGTMLASGKENTIMMHAFYENRIGTKAILR